ncbi:MAG TPA: helix-turn-helix domain-containing protein [Gemmatimonadales bacterium]|jgi:predicted site-specific integrase-resolvase
MTTTAVPTERFQLLDEREAARRLGVKHTTLQQWRHHGGGPPFVRISARCIRYRLEDLERFAAERLRASTSDDGSHAQDA